MKSNTADDESAETSWYLILSSLPLPFSDIRIRVRGERLTEYCILNFTEFAQEKRNRLKQLEQLPDFEAALRLRAKQLGRLAWPGSEDSVINDAIRRLSRCIQMNTKVRRVVSGKVNLAILRAQISNLAEQSINEAYTSFGMTPAQQPAEGNEERLVFCHNFKYLYELCQFSALSLAVDCDVTRQTPNKWLNGKILPPDQKLRLLAPLFAKELGVEITVQDLFSSDLQDRIATQRERQKE